MEGISSVSPVSGNRNTTVMLTIALKTGFSTPPPNNVPPSAITLKKGATTLTATGVSCIATSGDVTASFALGSATGVYTVGASFAPNTWSLADVFTVN